MLNNTKNFNLECIVNLSKMLTYGWDGSHNFSKFELVKNCCFACGVETHHENSHLFLTEHFKQACKHIPHDAGDGNQLW